MNAKDFIKKILPGVLPLLIFIIADELFETSISLIIAISVGIIQAVWIFVKERRFDYFLLVDTGLIVLLGGISLISHNDLFFKLKPGIIELILCIMMIFIAFAPPSILSAMIGRYGMSVELNDQSIKTLRKNLKMMTLIFFAHTLLVFYSAFYMSKEAWGFISGVLFYMLFVAYLAFEFLRNIIQRKRIEWLPVIDKDGKIIGKASRDIAHQDKSLLHPVVHLHVLNKQKQLFLQKRAMHKKVQPGKWDTAVGGHISWGETLEQALKRETKEEIGIQLNQAKFIKQYIWETDIERELVYVFVTECDETLKINKKEIEEGKFWTKKEIVHNLHRGIFTPNFEQEFNIIAPFLK